ncbi:FAD-dependent oxidoreductase [Bordetella sp. 15P40C-2]|uniref:FAD-dependent oxidoreductase n=1 Tax=Bordetella sp. 15P40C-2 TaxID=2572246 RepID=UPI0013291C3C|nr:FAD-dependent oxidoreductase [Bordetella sp. 15P40C-2]MVW72927.1 FAD-dependent oxidoreductase [Bordetella sp. 15P40C-2]
MAVRPLQELNDQQYDVLVIGGGVNGASSAHHLAAAGYSVLLVEKGDFGSGTSSRSSRILGNGMHYLAGGHSPWDFLFKPKRFLTGCRMARFALASRGQMVQATPERLNRVKFAFPIYKNNLYRPWQFDAGIKVLEKLGTHGVGLGYKRISAQDARNQPLLKWLRHPDQIASVATFDQYQFNWPERVVVDTVMHAQEMGAEARNYTRVEALARDSATGKWHATLRDVEHDETARVSSQLVLNAAGIWIDQVNRLAGDDVGQKITGTKGIHIAVRLPPECRDACVTWQNSQNEHMYVLPWKGLHYIGPTETLYEGNLDDIYPTEEEIAWVIKETLDMLPGMPLSRADVQYAWAGVRPWTYSPQAPKGLRVRVLHDLASEGHPGMLALTGGPLMSHRSAGQEVLAGVRERLSPSGSPKTISYHARLHPDADELGCLPGMPEVSYAALRYAAKHEYPRHLVDLLFRRVPAGWSDAMRPEIALPAAQSVADILGYSAQQCQEEADAYARYLKRYHLVG